MRDLVCSVAVGKNDTTILADLDKDEEDYEVGEGATDLAIAKVAKSDEFTLVQMDGKIQPEVFDEAMNLGSRVCEDIYEVQKKALKEAVDQ